MLSGIFWRKGKLPDFSEFFSGTQIRLRNSVSEKHLTIWILREKPLTIGNFVKKTVVPAKNFGVLFSGPVLGSATVNRKIFDYRIFLSKTLGYRPFPEESDKLRKFSGFCFRESKFGLETESEKWLANGYFEGKIVDYRKLSKQKAKQREIFGRFLGGQMRLIETRYWKIFYYREFWRKKPRVRGFFWRNREAILEFLGLFSAANFHVSFRKS